MDSYIFWQLQAKHTEVKATSDEAKRKLVEVRLTWNTFSQVLTLTLSNVTFLRQNSSNYSTTTNHAWVHFVFFRPLNSQRNCRRSWSRWRRWRSRPTAGELRRAVMQTTSDASNSPSWNLTSESLSFVVLISLLEKLRALVAMNENLKQQEQEFRTHCRVRTHTQAWHTCCISLFPLYCRRCLYKIRLIKIKICINCTFLFSVLMCHSGRDGPPAAEHRRAEICIWTGHWGGEGNFMHHQTQIFSEFTSSIKPEFLQLCPEETINSSTLLNHLLFFFCVFVPRRGTRW